MVRIAGILCGSAIAIAILIVALGIPEIRVDEIDTAETVVEGPVPSVEAELVEAKRVEVEMADAEIPAAEIPPALIPEPANEPVAQAAEDDVEQPAAPTENWFAFWSPFRSEVAANGFIAQLQRETGIDYRVVKVKTGVYEVAFAYDGETDIEAKLATISRATGLEMPDG
jgi:hypothetical protein